MALPILLLLGAAILTFGYLRRVLMLRHDPREPPLISADVPLIGHILGLLRYSFAYYAKISGANPLLPPIFTLDLLVTKFYVVNSSNLVEAVQNHRKVFSFDPFLTDIAYRAGGIGGSGLNLLREKEKGGHGVMKTVIHDMKRALLGSDLDAMNESMIKNLETSLDDLEFCKGGFDLNMWLRHVITVASTDAVYGPFNPYRNEGVESAFWQFEKNLGFHMLSLWPKITARKAYYAREKVVAGFIKYFEAGSQSESSQMTKARWKAQHDAGATIEDIARLEALNGLGILTNTVPSLFWALFDIYSRPALLKDIRAELLANALHIDNNSDEATHIVDLGDIKDKCPLLISTYQEVLRLRSTNGALPRHVYRDIMLNDQYLLKAGSILQMPIERMNREKSTWGEDSTEFNPSRFMAEQKSTVRVTGFMSFGTFPNICPGRHFATGEILAVVAMMILRYDIIPIDGIWKFPKVNHHIITASITPPLGEFNVKVFCRNEFAGRKWGFRVTKGKGKFPLIIG